MTTKGAHTTQGTRKRRGLLIVLGIVLASALVWVLVAVLGGFNGTTEAGGQQSGGQDASAIADIEQESTIEPVTSFEDTKPSDWPEGETSGCQYVTERLAVVQADLEADGLDGMRLWFDGIDALQGDPSMAEFAREFETVKRDWSTVLANAETDEDADNGELLAEGKAILQQLVDKAKCE